MRTGDAAIGEKRPVDSQDGGPPRLKQQRLTVEERTALTEEALATEKESLDKDVAELLGMIGQDADRDAVVKVLTAAARRVSESSLGSAAKLTG